MIICSCAVISERDIEGAVIELMREVPALLPTPGVVFRHLNKKMNCCSCAPVTVAAIYAAMDRLSADQRIDSGALAEARSKLIRIEERRAARERRAEVARLADREVRSAPRLELRAERRARLSA